MHCMVNFTGPVDRDEIGVEHFQGWIDWAREPGRESWISIRAISRTPKAAMDSRSLTLMRAFASSGSITASHVAESPRRWGRLKALRASTTSGFRTDTKTRQPIARRRVSDWPHRSTQSLPKSSRSASHARRRRVQTVWHRQRKLCGRFARVLSGLRDLAKQGSSASTPGTFIRPK